MTQLYNKQNSRKCARCYKITKVDLELLIRWNGVIFCKICEQIQTKNFIDKMGIKNERY